MQVEGKWKALMTQYKTVKDNNNKTGHVVRGNNFPTQFNRRNPGGAGRCCPQGHHSQHWRTGYHPLCLMTIVMGTDPLPANPGQAPPNKVLQVSDLL